MLNYSSPANRSSPPLRSVSSVSLVKVCPNGLDGPEWECMLMGLACAVHTLRRPHHWDDPRDIHLNRWPAISSRPLVSGSTAFLARCVRP